MKRSVTMFLTAACLASAGCHAPLPNVRGLFAAAGPTRVAPPATGSYTVADTYYPEGGSEAGPPPRASTQPLDISASPPYQPPAGGSLSPPPQTVAPVTASASPRVVISGGAAQGMPATELSREPSSFAQPTRMLDISELPPATSRAPSPNAILLPGTLNAFPRGSAPAQTPPRRAIVGGDAWESRD